MEILQTLREPFSRFGVQFPERQFRHFDQILEIISNVDTTTELHQPAARAARFGRTICSPTARVFLAPVMFGRFRSLLPKARCRSDIGLFSFLAEANSADFFTARSTSGEVASLSHWPGWVRIPHASLYSLRGSF